MTLAAFMTVSILIAGSIERDVSVVPLAECLEAQQEMARTWMRGVATVECDIVEVYP